MEGVPLWVQMKKGGALVHVSDPGALASHGRQAVLDQVTDAYAKLLTELPPDERDEQLIRLIHALGKRPAAE